jgi:hypothetical protein
VHSQVVERRPAPLRRRHVQSQPSRFLAATSVLVSAHSPALPSRSSVSVPMATAKTIRARQPTAIRLAHTRTGARITSGNVRLVRRLFSQIQRILEINQLTTVTHEVVEAARETLVIGAT